MFHTDHHFQIQGSVVAYETICHAYGREPKSLGEPYIAYANGFVGSNARMGLIDEITDVVYDVQYTPSSITVWFDDTKVGWSRIDKQFLPSEQEFSASSPFENLYESWFHSHRKLIEYQNDDIDDSAGSLLIIGDSYINSGDRFYAESWKHVS